MSIVMDSGAKDEAMQNIEDLCNEGQAVILVKPATQDEFGEPTSKTRLTVYAHPIRYEPFNRSYLAKVAWAEDMDVVIHIAKKTQDDSGRNIEAMRLYSEMRPDGKRFEIQRIEKHMQVGSDFLYYLIGGKKG